MPSGSLFTFEFNQNRKEKAEQDFIKTGLSKIITATHRDVLENGFLLEDKVKEESVDAVFLDLPRPEEAVKHAYQVLKHKGKLCNFSPCIEQVQKASQEMAKLGFYDIRTFESLSREMCNSNFQYKSIHDTEDLEDQKADKPKKGSEANRRKAKQFTKSLRPATV